MSPLEDGSTTYQDNEYKPLNWWKNMLGVTSNTSIETAARKFGIVPTQGDPVYPGMPNTKLLPVEVFPKVIEGIKRLIRPSDHYVFYPWAQDAHTDHEFFLVEPPNGKMLIYTYPESDPVDTTNKQESDS